MSTNRIPAGPDAGARMAFGQKLGAWLIAAAVAVTAVLVVYMTAMQGMNRRPLEKLLFTAWTLGPPAWFLLQYRLWPPTPGRIEEFRLHQSLATCIWAGVVAFLAAIFFGRWG